MLPVRGEYGIGKKKMERIYALHPILHINELESKELSGCTSAEDAAEKLCFLTGNTVIVTLGENGTYCRERSGIAYTVPGIPTAVVDTIGAGDSHIGAVMASLSLGNSLRKSIHIANTRRVCRGRCKGSFLNGKRIPGNVKMLGSKGLLTLVTERLRFRAIFLLTLSHTTSFFTVLDCPDKRSSSICPLYTLSVASFILCRCFSINMIPAAYRLISSIISSVRRMAPMYIILVLVRFHRDFGK